MLQLGLVGCCLCVWGISIVPRSKEGETRSKEMIDLKRTKIKKVTSILGFSHVNCSCFLSMIEVVRHSSSNFHNSRPKRPFFLSFLESALFGGLDSAELRLVCVRVVFLIITIETIQWVMDGPCYSFSSSSSSSDSASSSQVSH